MKHYKAIFARKLQKRKMSTLLFPKRAMTRTFPPDGIYVFTYSFLTLSTSLKKNETRMVFWWLNIWKIKIILKWITGSGQTEYWVYSGYHRFVICLQIAYHIEQSKKYKKKNIVSIFYSNNFWNKLLCKYSKFHS